MSANQRSTSGRTGLRTRWQAWWLGRHPRNDTLTLTQRNVYILPTRAGWMLALTLLLLLVGSINYQLNLGYLLTFLLAGCAAVSMHVSHNNLRGLQLHLQPGDSVFAGQAAPVQVTLRNPGRRKRYALALRWLPAASGGDVLADASPQDSERIELRCPTSQRGLMAVPPVEIESRFPLGAFRVWSWWRPAAQILVLPAPETRPPPLPLGNHADDGPATGPLAQRQGDEPDGVRPYRRGDPLKLVVWKKAAKHTGTPEQGWVSRDFNDPPTAQLWLDHANCGLGDLEGQLSRLCAWVLLADDLGLDYGLRLPGEVIAPGHGPAHRQHCLEAMACC